MQWAHAQAAINTLAENESPTEPKTEQMMIIYFFYLCDYNKQTA